MGTPSASIPQNQREAPLPAGLSRWRSGIAVGHVTEGSWFDSRSRHHFFQRSFSIIISHHLYVCMYVYIYIYIYMRKMSARSDVSSWRSAPTTILYLVFAVSCCTSVVTAPEKARFNMRTTEKIKSTFKEALRTKRIRDETPTVKIPTKNFDEFTKLLTPQEWKSFEEQGQWL